MAEKLLELGNGIEIWEVSPMELREQDVNARAMSSTAMKRLSDTIKRDARLESMPFCAITYKNDKEVIEIVSGHHRVRAASMANLDLLFVMVDTTGLTKDQIKAKQLAHNAIQGEDNAELLLKIYESISDVDARLEAFIEADDFAKDLEAAQSQVVDLGLEYKTIQLNFFPYDHDKFVRVVELLGNKLHLEQNPQYLLELDNVKLMRNVLGKVEKEYEVHAFGVIFGVMAEIVLEALGEPTPDDWIPFKKIFGSTGVPADVAEKLNASLSKSDKGAIEQLEEWAEMANDR